MYHIYRRGWDVFDPSKHEVISLSVSKNDNFVGE